MERVAWVAKHDKVEEQKANNKKNRKKRIKTDGEEIE
jgi:hypothetical protein